MSSATTLGLRRRDRRQLQGQEAALGGLGPGEGAWGIETVGTVCCPGLGRDAAPPVAHVEVLGEDRRGVVTGVADALGPELRDDQRPVTLDRLAQPAQRS